MSVAVKRVGDTKFSLFINGKESGLSNKKSGADLLLNKKLNLVDNGQRFVIFGAALGNFLEPVRPECEIIIYEPDKNHKDWFLSKENPLLAKISNLDLKVVSSRQELYEIINATEESSLIPFKTLIHSEYRNHFQAKLEEFNDMTEAFKKEIESARKYFRSRYLKAMKALKNLDHITKLPYTHWMNRNFSNLPAVIVSAGPSLDESIPLLKEFQSRCLIFCVFTAVKTLLENDIKPHFVVSTESKPLGYASHGTSPSKINLQCATWSDEEVFEKGYADLQLIPLMDDPVSALLFNRRIAQLPDGGGVSVTALMQAYFAGMNPIMLVGQDCAYPKGKTYSSGSNFGGIKSEIKKSETGEIKVIFPDSNKISEKLDQLSGKGKKFEHQFVERKGFIVKGYNQEDMVTTLELLEVLDWLSAFGRRIELKDPGFKLFNGSIGGAMIDSVALIDPRTFFLQYAASEATIKKFLAQQSSLRDSALPSKEDINNFYETFKSFISDLEDDNYISLIKERHSWLGSYFFPALFLKGEDLSGIGDHRKFLISELKKIF